MPNKMNIVSFFSGAGGLDLGFKQAGFNIIWANEYDSSIWETYRYNHTETELNTNSITNLKARDIPDCIGMIGGPPCQSWSEAGAKRGINDKRGQLFFDYIRLLEQKQPLFFLAENVAGLLHTRHKTAFDNLLQQFDALGYRVNYFLLNANDFEVPQDRKRVIIVGYQKSLQKTFQPPKKITPKPVLQDAIFDLSNAEPAKEKNYAHAEQTLDIPNHEYMTGGFSSIYMSRNRVRSWNEPSFTIQAGGRHAPIHPQAPKMPLVAKDKRIFVSGKEHLYRRLTVRECARIQTFPDDFIFKYAKLADGYKMVGNAVPVNFAKHLAKTILQDLTHSN